MLRQKQNIQVRTHFCPDPGGRGCTVAAGLQRRASAGPQTPAGPCKLRFSVRAAQEEAARPPRGMRRRLGRRWGGTTSSNPALPPSHKLFEGISTSTSTPFSSLAPSLSPAFPPAAAPWLTSCCQLPPSFPPPPFDLPSRPVHHPPAIKHPAGADKLHIC